MSNLYNLTKQIHELLPQVKAKYGLGFEIESNFYWSFDLDTEEDKKTYICEEFKKDFKACGGGLVFIEAPQIRQILVGLQEVLGENPERLRLEEQVEKTNPHSHYKYGADYDVWKAYTAGQVEVYYRQSPLSRVEALCHRWLDGLEPLFNREPETVLQELTQILQNLLK